MRILCSVTVDGIVQVFRVSVTVDGVVSEFCVVLQSMALCQC